MVKSKPRAEIRVADDRLRQEVLEGLGWRLHSIWSTDWFRNPQRESDKLLAAIKAAKDKAGRPKDEVIEDDDLVEMEQHDSVSEGTFATAANELDELLVLSNTT